MNRYSQKEELKKIGRNRCEFENCDHKAKGIIRTFYVCSGHWKMISKDNKNRIVLGFDIPKDLNMLETTKESFTFELHGK